MRPHCILPMLADRRRVEFELLGRFEFDFYIKSGYKLKGCFMFESSWIAQIFNSCAAQNGGIVRRRVSDVLRFSSPSELERAVRARGFHMLLSGDQYVIVCDREGALKIVC
jgi:hypothetical protein